MGSRVFGRVAGITIFLASFIIANAGHELGSTRAAAPSSPQLLPSQAAAEAAQDDFSLIFKHMRGMPNATIQIALYDAPHHLIWVVPVDTHAGGFLGRVIPVSDGAVSTPVALGDVVRFEQSQVRDWHFAAIDGTLYGNFAVRDRLAGLPEHELQHVRNILSDSPRPLNWF